MRKASWALILMTACGGGDPKVDALWAGLEGAVRSPQKVEAFRLAQPDKPEMDYPAVKETAGPVALDASSTKEVSTLLLDPASYYRGAPKKCLPTPGVKLKFTGSSGSAVWVYLCFECKILIVYDGSTLRGQDDFDPAAPALATIVKKLFPKDAAIQALK